PPLTTTAAPRRLSAGHFGLLTAEVSSEGERTVINDDMKDSVVGQFEFRPYDYEGFAKPSRSV
ncbi:hypothetical protein, partial [Mesorhizobium sp.]